MINLTQKVHYPASAETERSSNEQVLNSRRKKKKKKKERTTRLLLNSFISMTIWVLLCRTKFKKCLWRNISLRKAKLIEKFIFRVKQVSWWFPGLCLYKQQRGLNCSPGRCLNDRKAAYHVPHRLATDICHLQSFSFPLSLPASLTHIYTLLHTRTHCSASAEVPTSKASLPLISLITQTVRSSTPPSSSAQRIEKKEKREKGRGKTEGDESFIQEGSYVLKGSALAAKTFLWHVSNWYFEMAAYSAEVMGQFPLSADWEMRMWC